MSNFKKNNLLSPKTLAFTAICIALAYVLREISPFRMPQGGRVAVGSTLFLALVGYFYGVKVGFIAGVTFGLLRLISATGVVHPIGVLIDYPLAFGVFGVSGFFKNSKLGLHKGYILGCFARFVLHVISGVIFFAEYAGDSNPIIYSSLYNISHISVEMGITLVIISIPPLYEAIKTIKRKLTYS